MKDSRLNAMALTYLGIVMVLLPVPAAEAGSQVWRPMPMDQVRVILNDSSLSPTEKVARLTVQLDERISMSGIKGGPNVGPTPGSEYGSLIALMATRGYSVDAQVDFHPIEAVLDKLDSTPEIQNKQEVRSYLNVALLYARGNPPESEILKSLNNSDTPKEVINLILQGFKRTHVPIRALPRLLELADEPWNYVHWPGVGPQKPEKISPIKNEVAECLHALGVKAEKVPLEDKESDEWGNRLTSTSIVVDRQSLRARLRELILDDNNEVWQPAVDAVRKIPGNDIRDLVNGLVKSDSLPDAKKRALSQ